MVDPSGLLPPGCDQKLASRSIIDRAGDALRDDPFDAEAREHVQCFRLFRLTALDSDIDVVLAAVGDGPGLMSCRLKRVSSTIRKLTRFGEMRLSRMTDIVGLRIVCESLQAVQNAAAVLKDHERVGGKMADYLANPQPTGYRGIHVYLSSPQPLPGKENAVQFRTEIQVRSYWQHLWALKSESLGEQVKEGGGRPETREYLLRLSSAIRDREEAEPDAVQTTFPDTDQAKSIAVVRQRRAGEGPVVDPFGHDYDRAIAQLVTWENADAEGTTDTLLLVGVGGTRVLGYTHAVFLGLQQIPLPEWAPDP